MTGSDGAVVVSVTGGATGIAATYERLLALAVTFEVAAERMRGWAARGAAVLVDGDLLASGLLAPLSLAEAEVAVVTATTGPDGVLGESAGWWLDAEALRLAVRLLQEADELAEHALDALDHALGRALGQGLALSLGPPPRCGCRRWPGASPSRPCSGRGCRSPGATSWWSAWVMKVTTCRSG